MASHTQILVDGAPEINDIWDAGKTTHTRLTEVVTFSGTMKVTAGRMTNCKTTTCEVDIEMEVYGVKHQDESGHRLIVNGPVIISNGTDPALVIRQPVDLSFDFRKGEGRLFLPF